MDGRLGPCSGVAISCLGHPYEEFLHKVDKPTRYTGREHGSRSKDWTTVSGRICLAFPDIYDIGTSHLGFRILYSILNDDPTLLAERCFAPWVDLRNELIARQLPLVSLESWRPLCEFDIVGFSLQFELTYTNILGMLKLGRIPLRSAERSETDPLVLAGGPVATHAEPMAPFLDALLIGDGEQATLEIAKDWVRTRELGWSRADRLRSLSQIPGVYVPSLYEVVPDEQSQLFVVQQPPSEAAPFPVKRRILKSLEEHPFPASGPVGGPEAVFDRMSVEIARGCTEGCRFCQAGMIYRPVRERPPAQILQTVSESIEQSGQDEISLSSLSTADVSYISPLIKTLVRSTAKERVSLGVASLRAYGLGEDILSEFRKVRATGLTFAPEAGTQRLRDVINKNVTEEQILTNAEQVFAKGWHRMKLYFILGLPTETDEDLIGILQLARRVLEIGRKHSRKRPEVTVSVSVHVPKPHTPFQWCPMDSFEEIRRKQGLLRSQARYIKGLQLKLHDPTASVLECLLARGDRRFADVIESAFNAGAGFDTWDEQFNLQAWNAALDQFEIDRDLFLRTIPVIARVPWDHVDVGLAPGFLAREYRAALKGRLSPPCGKPLGSHVHHTNLADATQDARKLVCYACGVECDLSQMREQRLQFLDHLGATGTTAAEPEPTPTPAGGVDEPAVALPTPEALRPARSFASSAHYRFRFGKLGAAALLGHGDLIRELPRALRRAGVRLQYTQGFHPKPDLSFAPALSLGVASIDEYFDAVVIDPPPVEHMLDRLAAEQSSGLWFRAAMPLAEGATGLAKLIASARYALLVPRDRLQQDTSQLNAAIAEFFAQESVVVQRQKEHSVTDIDVRRYVLRLEAAHAETAAMLQPFLSTEDAAIFELEVSVGQAGSVKPREVVQAVWGRAAVDPIGAIRIGLLDSDGCSLAVSKITENALWTPGPAWGNG